MIGSEATHAAPQQLKRRVFREQIDDELAAVAQSTRSAVISIDQGPSQVWQCRHQTGAEALWKMIDMTFGEADMTQPVSQCGVVHAMQHRWPAELSGNLKIEAKGVEFEELLAGNIVCSDYGTAGAIVVMAQAQSTHNVSFR
ncbi:MAG: hypothetical protein BGO25_10360 [Acidobacteriales bacterium 59-55]|nr:MAG: hypothetical protein BGO25_10360 [Acidobacteriales bacterium 59-55]